jgi:hypothetical protein
MKYLIIFAIASLLTISSCPHNNCADIDLPEISSFTVYPDIVESGEQAKISWMVANAAITRIEPAIGHVGPQGKAQVKPSGSCSYTLFAENDCGKVEKTVTITVLPQSSTDNSSDSPPIIDYFRAEPDEVWAGAGTKLVWQVSNATSLNIQWDTNERNLNPASSGSIVFQPVIPTTYILVANNDNGNAIAIVKVDIISSIGGWGGGGAGGGGGG